MKIKINSISLVSVLIVLAILFFSCGAQSKSKVSRVSKQTEIKGTKSSSVELSASMFVTISTEYDVKQAYLKEAKEIVKSLKQVGFSEVDISDDIMYTSDETPIKAITQTLNKNGIYFYITYTVEDGASMSRVGFFFDDSDKLYEFVKTFKNMDFKPDPYNESNLNADYLDMVHIIYGTNEGEIVMIS